MRDLPDITQIIDLVEDSLEEPEEALAARGRAIATRELQHGAAPYAAIAAEFAALIGEAQGAALLSRLVGQIRAGRFDEPGPEQAQLEDLLWRFACLRLAENDPYFMYEKR
jgi:hypothetical protein